MHVLVLVNTWKHTRMYSILINILTERFRLIRFIPLNSFLVFDFLIISYFFVYLIVFYMSLATGNTLSLGLSVSLRVY